MNNDPILDEIQGICEHLLNNYAPAESMSISISVMINMINFLEKEHKQLLITQLYTVLDNLKFNTMDEYQQTLAIH